VYGEEVFRQDLPHYLMVLNGKTVSFESNTIDTEGFEYFEIITLVPHYSGELVSGFFVSIMDITDRKLAEDALQRVNQKLNVLSQLTRKDLTSQTFVLSGYLELVKNQLAGQDRIIETVEKGIQAVRFIHETIEYSKDYQDMGAKPPKWQNVKMALLLGLSHISIGKIQHSIETENLQIFADPLVEMVCQRLCENSVKHGDHVTMIRVRHTITPDRATIVFEDDGIGIPQELKEQIFLRDECSGRASMRSLIFVREILDITGITIRETGEPGKGARFEIVVPKGAYRVGK
jgi:signal transduction histidine kinase